MATYGTHRPTAYDRAGAFLPERQDWHVAPVSRTRDSSTLEESNFAVALETLGGESETVEVHRFGHWANGWYELILVAPERAGEVAAIAARLEDYPILDEEDHSSREWEAAWETWSQAAISDRIAWCAKWGASIFAARRRDELPAHADISYLADGN